MSSLVPVAAMPVASRLAVVDLPTPGGPPTNTPGLVVSPARTHSSGSRQTTSPHSMCRPIGTPNVGAPDPAMNGYRPQSWVVVPWYSMPGATWAARPAPGPRQPHAGAIADLATAEVLAVEVCIGAP